MRFPAAGLSAVTAAFLLGPTLDASAGLIPPHDVGRASPDTIHLEIGSPELDGRVFEPHRARNRVYIGDSHEIVSTWTNELTLGDSAGIPVMRWVSQSETLGSGGHTWRLLQTYHARTMEPLGYWLTVTNGHETKLRMDGKRIHGTSRQDAAAPAEDYDRIQERRGFFANASDLVPVAVGLEAGRVLVAPFFHPSMDAPEERAFTVVREETVEVEGEPVLAWRVEEHRVANGELIATWWLTDDSPYMVLAELKTDDGQTQRITGVAEDS